MYHFCICFVLMVMSTSVSAQKEFDVWCYGGGFPDAIKVTFGENGPLRPSGTCAYPNVYPNGYTMSQTIITFGAPGGASICDVSGRLLLYSNGTNVIDRRQWIMPNGSLNNVTNTTLHDNWWIDPSRQSCAIAPGPDGLYYVFYWIKDPELAYATYGLSYAVVDMRLNGGFGDVVRKQLLSRTFSPRVTIVRHRNNRDFWVVSRDLDSRGFQSFLLNKKGVSNTPVLSMAGETLFPNLNELKAAPNGQHLVCGAVTQTDAAGPMGCVCVYDFDNATGRASNELVVQRNPIAPYRVTDKGQPVNFDFSAFAHASFSPDSKLLYSIEQYLVPADARRPNDLWQYDLTQTSPQAISRSRYRVSNAPLLPPANYRHSSGLQLTPDSTLWMAFYTGTLLDPVTGQLLTTSSPIIRHPNVVGPGCGFDPVGYTYLPGQAALTFPNIITNMLYAPPALNYEVGCADDSTQFWASSAGLPAGLRWDFGDPDSGPANTASGSQVAHRYARSGSYPVRLLLVDGRVLTQVVTVAAQTADFTGANVFTPNNDGLNDAFVPVRGALPGGRLRVFSRWGIPVFGTDDAEALRWDGAGAAGGEYFYQLDYPDCQGQPRHRRGIITLVR